MKVLLTGCTAQHISAAANDRIPTFAGLVRTALESQGAEVIWTEPYMEMNRDFIAMFDSVVVGISSPASVAANHIYPALWVAAMAQESSKLTLMVDSPEPHKLWAGLASVAQNRGTLVKDFYARRKGFREAVAPERQAALQGFVEALVGQEWPLTIAPALPWTDPAFLTRHIPRLAENRSLGLRLDRGLELPLYNLVVESVEQPVWYADAPTSGWTQKVSETLANPTLPLRGNRLETIADIAARVRGSLGLLATIHRGNEPWWSPLYMTTLAQRVPVVSEWRSTYVLGPKWSQLATSVEVLSLPEREDFAKSQLDAYLSAVPEFKDESARLAHSMTLVDRTQ